MKKHPFLIEKRKIPAGDHSVGILILRPLNRSAGPAPGVLWVHGGGYQSGSAKEVFATRALSLVTKFGAVLVAPDYRLSRKHPYPAGLQDCYAALLYLKEHAGELGARPDQIMVGGESAGGGMTAALCMLAHDRGEVRIAFQMPLYPMLDDRDTPSSRDNHALNWNTKRNHKAWKRYLRDAYGTDMVPDYAAPARRETAKRWTTSGISGRPAFPRRRMFIPAGSMPMISSSRRRKNPDRRSKPLRSIFSMPAIIISRPRRIAPGSRGTPSPE